MSDPTADEMTPDLCASKIFEISGEKFAPEIAAGLWPKILKHKWLLSDKLRRDVGLRVKESGFGRLMGDEGLLEFVRVKSVTGARVTFPREPHWFPYRPRDVIALRALLRVWFRPGVVGRVRALFGR